MNAELRQELFFKAPTRVGLLADVTEALAKAGVNIQAIGAYDKNDMGEFLLVTSNNRTAAEALQPLGGELGQAPVIVVEADNTPGQLAAISRAVSGAGINISQVHAATIEGPVAMIVLRADDESHALQLIQAL